MTITLEAFEAQDRVQFLLAQLSPRVSYVERVRLVRELQSAFAAAHLDKLSTFKCWASEKTELSEKSIQRAVNEGGEVSDLVLLAVLEKGIPHHGQETFIKRNVIGRPTEEQLAAIEAYGNDNDDPPPEPTGAVFQHGEIRSENVASEQRLPELVAEGVKAQLVFCDPPFGIDYESQTGQRVAGDKEPPFWCIEYLRQLVMPGGYIALWLGAETLYEWLDHLSSAGLTFAFKRWDKVNNVMRGRECVVVCSLDGWLPRLDFDLIHHSYHGQHYLQKAHPTPKPPEVMLPFVELLTKPGDLIIDPFAGTAPIGVAAIQSGRRYVGLELVPDHFDTGRGELEKAIAALRDDFREAA